MFFMEGGNMGAHGMNRCNQKGFALEVAGVKTPEAGDLPVRLVMLNDRPFNAKTPPKNPHHVSGLDSAELVSIKNFSCKIERSSSDSPHTVYMADLDGITFTKRHQRYAFALKVPGLKEFLHIGVAGSLPGKTESFAFKSAASSIHSNVFIPFRPVTGVHRSLLPETNSASGGSRETGRLVERTPGSKKGLRPLRSGFLYIFSGGKLWREILVSEEGSFTDINLEEARQEKDPEARNRRLPDKGLEKETSDLIWMPARLGGCASTGYSIAYSSVQWTWPYIGWLESDGERVQKRTQNLDDLFAAYGLEGHSQANRAELRFGPNKFAVQAKNLGAEDIGRASLLREVLHDSSFVVRSPHLNSFDTVFPRSSVKGYFNDSTPYFSMCGEDRTLRDEFEKKPCACSVCADADRNGWGLFFVEDDLCNILFYIERIKFYTAMLGSLNSHVEERPSALLSWRILEEACLEKGKGSHENDEYRKYLDEVAAAPLMDVIRPGWRKTLRRAILDMQVELALLLGVHVANLGFLGNRAPETISFFALPGLGLPGRMADPEKTRQHRHGLPLPYPF